MITYVDAGGRLRDCRTGRFAAVHHHPHPGPPDETCPNGCICPPCPGRGTDGHGMAHCAECCFGTGVEVDLDCPVHGPA